MLCNKIGLLVSQVMLSHNAKSHDLSSDHNNLFPNLKRYFKMRMGNWRINVSYDVTEKCKNNNKKNSNIEDKPLSCYL